jgi:hypothetical protein
MKKIYIILVICSIPLLSGCDDIRDRINELLTEKIELTCTGTFNVTLIRNDKTTSFESYKTTDTYEVVKDFKKYNKNDGYTYVWRVSKLGDYPMTNHEENESYPNEPRSPVNRTYVEVTDKKIELMGLNLIGFKNNGDSKDSKIENTTIININRVTGELSDIRENKTFMRDGTTLEDKFTRNEVCQKSNKKF